jgi:hypothetical protein
MRSRANSAYYDPAEFGKGRPAQDTRRPIVSLTNCNKVPDMLRPAALFQAEYVYFNYCNGLRSIEKWNPFERYVLHKPT